ncbi:3'(2'),5'-bisphosphate nucleotidase CysQ [Paraferrimonas sedimenticola]|uniref:3'(2'),5'-bisphosphate nucleotidase CysQ n=1 Tax=Paraferrimonas sedimenticola TaxID=375674 RepID=A0AA37RVC3_9GAMM|nr:3'(2'),5'-bisphosphate nucleotidase CysQ [Paraferrimonas sedimenticola]GLP95911.1 3'(2'),5'-bisphosphate nucleotidase CysQ [Paraferrimonas sedimenticola]
MQPKDLVESAIEIATHAGGLIRDIYQSGSFSKLTKSDETPVTSADLAAHEYIVNALRQLTPTTPILSEEDANVPLQERGRWSRYWLVDPLDGTQEFIAGSGDFAVNIALIEDNTPVMGVVYAPMTKACYFAVKGQGAFKRLAGETQRIRTNKIDPQQLTELRMAVSRRQKTERLLAHLTPDLEYQLEPMGSAALKSCWIAEGQADCYIRLGPTGEWDTGATQCIVEQAGGQILSLQLEPLSYNQRESLENPDFVVLGEPQLNWEDILR